MKSRVNRFLMTSIFVLTMGVLLVGCEKSVENHNEQMTISGQIETLSEAGKTSSRAEVSDRTVFAVGEKIGVWVVPYKVTGTADGTGDVATVLRGTDNYKDNVGYTSAIENSFTGDAIYYPNDKVKVDVYAVAPYDEEMNTMAEPTQFAFSVQQDQATALNVIASDFLTAKATGKSAAGGPVALVFSHRLTRVLVSFTVPSKYNGATVSGVSTVELLGMKLKAVVDVSNNSATAIPSTVDNAVCDISMYQAEKTTTTPTTVTYEAIIVPGQTVNAKDEVVKISLNVEDIGVVGFIAQSAGTAAADSYTYLANTQYNITINLDDQTEVKLNPITIEPWGAEINVGANTTKLHTMKFTCVEGSKAIDVTAKKATLTIQGIDYKDCAVTYEAGVYTVKYDAAGNFGGYLTSFKFFAADGTSGLFEASALNKQVKGDPAEDNYDEKIGTITFNTNSVTFE